MKNPLDNRGKNLDAQKRGTYQYFLKVVPTEYTYLSGKTVETNQFSVTEHFLELTPVSEKGLPSTFPPSKSPVFVVVPRLIRCACLQ